MSVHNVVQYDEGFAIIEDDAGKFLTFADSDHIEPLSDNELLDFRMDLKEWKQSLLKSRLH